MISELKNCPKCLSKNISRLEQVSLPDFSGEMLMEEDVMGKMIYQKLQCEDCKNVYSEKLEFIPN